MAKVFSVVTGIEVTAIIHGFLGTIFLMAFAGALAELIEITHSGVNRLKIGVSLMFASVVITDLLGDFIYTIYRSPAKE
ncbi:MAG: hypothetical protein EPN86_01025, partial [Nanoarchaeota archaeon]